MKGHTFVFFILYVIVFLQRFSVNYTKFSFLLINQLKDRFRQNYTIELAELKQQWLSE